ncbi:hypothetical protein QAD02_021577 [Eretmocerus hayati]|uniref:Uncharacterized protein n=1 Tax=Eretmocerus hayati TaxID=131215 RepID=A0ACC2PR48_9HYME|nr:hypothetical protein QAD02_021577 [Eretmocerus hayati]
MNEPITLTSIRAILGRAKEDAFNAARDGTGKSFRRKEDIGKYIAVSEPSEEVKVVLKRALFWMFQEGQKKISSDRLLRVRDNDLINKSKLPRSSLPADSDIYVAEQVNRCEWCLFRRLETYHPSTPPCLVGRVRMFAYMHETKKSKTRYSNKVVNVKNNSKQIGASCDWYAVSDDGILERVYCTYGFLEIEQYECTIKRPTKCATKEQHNREIDCFLKSLGGIPVHQTKKRRTKKKN